MLCVFSHVCVRFNVFHYVDVVWLDEPKRNPPWQSTLVVAVILSPLATTLGWLCAYVCVSLTFFVYRNAFDSFLA